MATNKQARARAQEARRRAAEVRRQEEKKARRGRMLRITALVAALVIVGGGTAAGVVLTRHSSCSSIKGVKCYKETRLHKPNQTINYAQTPPAGGDHDPTWLNCGIYTQPVRNENAVHDLEHGAVWITYRPDLAAADVATLTTLVKAKTKGYLDLSPYPNLPTPVVASAWGVQLKLQSVSDPRLAQFVDKYQLGPTAPERGASCTGGTGTPSG